MLKCINAGAANCRSRVISSFYRLFGIQNLISCFAIEPSMEYYGFKGLSSYLASFVDNGFSSFFGSKA